MGSISDYEHSKTSKWAKLRGDEANGGDGGNSSKLSRPALLMESVADRS